MTLMETLVGEVLHARDGGLHAPLDRAAFDRIQAQTAAGKKPRRMEASGVAYRYGMVGHFPFHGAVRIEAGAIIQAPGRHRRYRDILGLHGHNTDAVLARVGNNTMEVVFGDEEVTYAMRLNPNDPMAQSVWARLEREDINASSVGLVIVEGDWVEGYDNSLDGDTEAAGEKIDIFSVTEAHLLEVSLVTQGAFGGATAAPAEASVPEPVGAVAVAAVSEFDPIDHAVKNALPAEAAIVGDDDGQENGNEDDTGASASPYGDYPGDDTGGGAEVDGGAAPDGDGGTPAEEEAEAQGLTAKDIVGRMPYQVRRLLDGD